MRKTRRKNLSNSVFSKKELQELVLSLFRKFPNKAFNYKQLYKLIGGNSPELKPLITGVLLGLNKKGSVLEVRPGKYKLLENAVKIEGVVTSVSLKGVVVKTSEEQDVFVDLDYSRFSLIRDKVLLLVFPRKKQKQKGEVIRVVERAKKTFVGVIQNDRHYCFFIPNNKKVPFDIFIPKVTSPKKYRGKKVLVKVVDWSEGNKNPVGKVVSIIGDIEHHETEIHSILYEYGLPVDFPKNILSEANNIPFSISKGVLKNRRDFRGVDTFTIDPDDAKDFDDALSVRRIDDEKWEIGVHIADVSHFVKKGSFLDFEAKQRATSVYLVDRVVPMLPEVLSNEVCSLKPKEDRLCFSVLFTVTKRADVLDFWIGKSVIHSNKRFTYSEAQEIIDSKRGLFSEHLCLLEKLSKIIRKKRHDLGSLIFERSEIKFLLDEKNAPVDVSFKPILNTNHMIEEFMLLANKTITEFVTKKKKSCPLPFVYRVHDAPDQEKIEILSRLVRGFGYKLNVSSKGSLSGSLNNLHKQIKGTEEENMIETLIVRSMAKAIYTTNNIGHYGLGFDFYSHFTSPIRRYPDLIVHRILDALLVGSSKVSLAELDSLCKHCSEMERRASLAERESKKYMQTKYMAPNIGKKYEGIISGVTNWGFYVELIENRCEGLVKAKSLTSDYFVYDEKKLALTGLKTKVSYQLGQKVSVLVRGVSLELKQIDFTIV